METKTRASKHQVRHPHCPGLWSLVGTNMYGLTQDIKDNVFTHTNIPEYCTLTHISCTALRQIRGDKKTPNSPTNKTEGGDQRSDFVYISIILFLQGAVFDFPSECESQVLNYWTDGKFDTLCKATELPELQEKERPFSSGARGGRGRGSFGGRGRDFSSYNNRSRGGFGGRGSFGGRGGFGGRGSFGGRGGFKRSGDFGEASPQNKKIRF